MTNILLVEPEFPLPDKSRNHSHFLPIGLLKIGTWHRRKGDRVRLVRGLHSTRVKADRILITSLFTYWSEAVHAAAQFYHRRYPEAQIEIGGIYASLMAGHCQEAVPFAQIHQGLYRNGVAESIRIDFSLLQEYLDYQIVHTTRGCTRHCAFCGTWRIEPEFTWKRSIIPEIQKPRVVFYDNNLLANPHIDDILRELKEYRLAQGRRLTCESQSGFDLRLLTPHRARLLRDARFKYPRIAWDGPYKEWPTVRECVNALKEVGYGRKDIFVFMIYNHHLSYAEMRAKLDACRRWKVRVIDCRYRPLDQTFDRYVPGPKAQTADDYYIHPTWSDLQVRRFRRAVRHQNIAILLNLPNGRYVQGCESRKV
ncbi:MAG: radical SAM protein [Sedimentisphaerales bacterium]|nr:radical SAM protein [Sedimentisphaerales bacterium]